MSELEEAHRHSHSLALDRSSYQICWSHISSTDHPARTGCSAFGHRHRSAERVGDGAFAVDDGESRESVTTAVHNTFRCGEDGCSCWLSVVSGWGDPVTGGGCWTLAGLGLLQRDGWVYQTSCFYFEYSGMLQLEGSLLQTMVERYRVY